MTPVSEKLLLQPEGCHGGLNDSSYNINSTAQVHGRNIHTRARFRVAAAVNQVVPELVKLSKGKQRPGTGKVHHGGEIVLYKFFTLKCFGCNVTPRRIPKQ